jgi:hypothetical protein
MSQRLLSTGTTFLESCTLHLISRQDQLRSWSCRIAEHRGHNISTSSILTPCCCYWAVRSSFSQSARIGTQLTVIKSIIAHSIWISILIFMSLSYMEEMLRGPLSLHLYPELHTIHLWSDSAEVRPAMSPVARGTQYIFFSTRKTWTILSSAAKLAVVQHTADSAQEQKQLGALEQLRHATCLGRV